MIVGKPFSLSSPADVAHILFSTLKLPLVEQNFRKTSQEGSTSENGKELYIS